MLRLLAICILLATPLPLDAHPHDEPKAAETLVVEREVLGARDAIRTAVGNKDAGALRALYAADFSHTHGSGKMDGRDARIVALLSGEPVIEMAAVADLHVHVHGGATAIVTGRSPILNRAEGRTYEFRWMQVFTRIGTGWTLAASQATRLPTPPTN